MPSAKKTKPRAASRTNDVVMRADQVPAVREAELAMWDRQRDADIDTADIPELTDEDFAAMDRAARGSEVRPTRQLISLRIDDRVLLFFKSMGPGYQRRMHAVLRSYAERASSRAKR